MTKEEIFEAWAPDGVEWSAWTKPVLFAQWPDGVTPPASPPTAPSTTPSTTTPPSAQYDYLWLPQASGRTVLVVELPAVESVRAGLAFARRGYRPVPLFNTSHGPAAVINVTPLVLELGRGARMLKTMTVAPNAPPAFLLDADRMKPPVLPAPGKFDNRWVVFPQDFPSATFLRAHGVADALVIHAGGSVQEDLAHVLLRWQEAGIRILSASPTGAMPAELTVTQPSWFRRAVYRAIMVARLRRSNTGGFGAVIPLRSAGGGHFG